MMWLSRISVVADHELVRFGPYRLVRHPIYAAMLLMYVGVCVVSGELHAPVGITVLTAAYCRKIPQEEGDMREAFGTVYADYRKDTRAVIPGLL